MQSFSDDLIRHQPRQVWVTDLVVGLAAMLTIGFPYSLHSDFSFYFDAAVAASWLPLTGAVVLRRVSPRISFVLMTIGYLVKLLTGAPAHGSDLAILMTFYTTAALGHWRLFVLGATTAVIYPLLFATHLSMFPRDDLLVISDFSGRGLVSPSEFFITLVYMGLPLMTIAVVFWLAGLVQRMQVSRREAAHAAQLAEIEYERSQEQLVVEQERHQIARDMHDVVAHSLAVVVAQANGGRYLAKADPAKSQEVLGTIADTAREALVDVRALLAQLRHTQQSHSQQTMADLAQLYERLGAAGLRLEVQETGTPSQLGPVVQVAVYRLIQEALTNALKYGDNTRPTFVMLHWSAALEILVRNHLDAQKAPRRGPGHGLIGMRERILVIGGQVQAGVEEDEFVVRSRVPLHGDVLANEPAPARPNPAGN